MAELKGEIRFLHDGRLGPTIKISVADESARDQLLRKLCDDPEVEGFEGSWEPSRFHIGKSIDEGNHHGD